MSDKKNQAAKGPAKYVFGVWSFIKEAREELKKVSWPSRQETVRYTGIVVAASLVVGMLIGGVDYVLQLLIQRII